MVLRGARIVLKFGLDVKTDAATHAPRGYKEIYYLYNKTFSGEQSKFPKRFKNGLKEQEGELTLTLIELGCGARVSILTQGPGLLGLNFPPAPRDRVLVGFLLGFSRCESRGEKGAVSLKAVSGQTSEMVSDYL